MIGFGGRSSPCVFLLGYFDAVHIGHRALIARAKEIASELEIETGALTFTGGKKGAQVYVLKERERILSSLGVGFLYEADFESPFRDLSGEAFLETVADRCGVRAFVCGDDFRFGKGASCGADFLKRFCREREIEAEVLPLISFEGEKVSATLAKKYLDEGNIPKLNAVLGGKYFISGRVATEGRHVGRSLGFPTANLHPEPDKYPLSEGVYAVSVPLDGREYRGIANFGPRPTFGDGRVVCETYIDGYSGDLYGKELTVYFDFRIRDVRKFSSQEELRRQLQRDLEKIR